MAPKVSPLILYIPGLLPKPEASLHREALRRCMLEGIRRADPSIAEEVRGSDHAFDIVAWTYDFYGEYRDFQEDEAAIAAAIEQPRATADDIREAGSLNRRAVLALYRVGDFLPFLIPHLADEKTELHLRDLHRYSQNRAGIADRIRERLKLSLRAAYESRRPILLLAHSMGSVIAYDTLWELGHEDHIELRIDLLLTMGSPLGQRYLQRRLKGRGQPGYRRYPPNIRLWKNLAAVGDMTAIDPRLNDDFREMLKLGLVQAIDDISTYNYYRLDGKLNVHAEYGYLVNVAAGRVIADWWRRQLRRR